MITGHRLGILHRILYITGKAARLPQRKRGTFSGPFDWLWFGICACLVSLLKLSFLQRRMFSLVLLPLLRLRRVVCHQQKVFPMPGSSICYERALGVYVWAFRVYFGHKSVKDLYFSSLPAYYDTPR